MVLWGGRRGGGACSGGGAMMGQVGYGGGGGGGGAPVDPLGPRLERQLGERDGRGVGGIALAVEHDEGAQLQTMMSWGGLGVTPHRDSKPRPPGGRTTRPVYRCDSREKHGVWHLQSMGRSLTCFLVATALKG